MQQAGLTWRGRRVRAAQLLFLLATLGGCGSIVRLDSPPPEVTETLPVLGLTNARFWLDAGPEGLRREGALMAARQAALQPPGARGPLPPAHFLALSGGGDNGAFGAGLMVGWTASGQRPEFDVVTGVSAGALIAPFAFLGPAYDGRLREVFTEVTPNDIAVLRGKLRAVLFGEALVDASPLAALIRRQADDSMLAAIAAEYARGRLLLIGTTNLDLRRPVFWNIGAIAASGHPYALELFRSVLLASASIPGVFPPVLIDVEQGGRMFQEMHVDGGAALQMFLYPPTLDLREATRGRNATRERTAYLIRNGRVDVEFANTDRRIITIAGRAASTLLHFSAINDITRIFLTTQRDGVRFRLAYIGADFAAPRREPFDQDFMRALFDYGYRKARDGNPWQAEPSPVGTFVLPNADAALR